MTVTWPYINILKIQGGDGRHMENVGNAITRLAMDRFGRNLSGYIPSCSPLYGCRSNARCLVTAHWTFSSYGRVKAESVNQIWWNLQRLIWNSMSVTWRNVNFFNLRWRTVAVSNIVKWPHLNKKSFDFDEIWSSGGWMCEPISLKFGRSNFATPPTCLRWAVATATPVA